MPINPAAGDATGYRFAITGYAGFEEEILRLRNANRNNEQRTRQYFDWRYAATQGAPEPKVFWVISADGKRMGMAALIFRLYWVLGKPVHMAVLGDISLNESLRGKGIGQDLLRIVSEYIEETCPENPGFVIPNQAAERSLAAVGWKTVGQLTPHVLLLDSTARFHAILKFKWLARCCAWPVRQVIGGLLWLQLRKGYSLDIREAPDDSMDSFWKEFPKDRMIVRDGPRASLDWRFAAHPHTRFRFAKLDKNNRISGYLVFEVSEEHSICSIYQILVQDDTDVVPFLALFARRCAKLKAASSIRLLLNDQHPYVRRLWGLGFVARKPQGVFQVFGGEHAAFDVASWMITAADKDI